MFADPRALESLLAFWSDGGVDTCYSDAQVDRTQTDSPQTKALPATARPIAAAAPAVSDLIADPVDEARRLAQEAQDLAGLALAISAFDGCPLKGMGARQAVFGRGDGSAPVMVIGEAPGADEDHQGAPFVGRAGKLLDRILAAGGLDGRVFITNTVFWRPPGNRTPTLAEQQACAPFLERAIVLVRPRLLLLVGAAAVKSVLGQSEGILTLRGRWFEWRSSDGALVIPVMPTLHPAFLLRQPAAKKKLWLDILALTAKLEESP